MVQGVAASADRASGDPVVQVACVMVAAIWIDGRVGHHRISALAEAMVAAIADKDRMARKVPVRAMGIVSHRLMAPVDRLAVRVDSAAALAERVPAQDSVALAADLVGLRVQVDWVRASADSAAPDKVRVDRVGPLVAAPAADSVDRKVLVGQIKALMASAVGLAVVLVVPDVDSAGPAEAAAVDRVVLARQGRDRAVLVADRPAVPDAASAALGAVVDFATGKALVGRAARHRDSAALAAASVDPQVPAVRAKVQAVSVALLVARVKVLQVSEAGLVVPRAKAVAPAGSGSRAVRLAISA